MNFPGQGFRQLAMRTRRRDVIKNVPRVGHMNINQKLSNK